LAVDSPARPSVCCSARSIRVPCRRAANEASRRDG
jgi:hypothetical protein